MHFSPQSTWGFARQIPDDENWQWCLTKKMDVVYAIFC